MTKEGLTKAEMEEYNIIREEASRLAEEVASLRKQLAQTEIEFSDMCKKKWSFEERMVEVKVIPAGRSSKSPPRKAPSKEKALISMKDLIKKVNAGEISKAEFSAGLNSLIG